VEHIISILKINFKMSRIAVLLTCFNRKETTIKCLSSLFVLRDDIDIYLVDDGSTDGTYDAILNLFPQVTIIKGDGNLFWSRGMNVAWKEASSYYNYSFFLWLNDDVVLYENAFDEILECSKELSNKAIVTGVIENHEKSKVLYGGFDVNKQIIIPHGDMKPVTNLNGNFVLIPVFVFNKLGFIDGVYHHDLGDVDYGLRASKLDIKVVTTKKPIGSGDANSICRVRLNKSRLRKRFKKLSSPLGSNLRINFYFRKKHKGFLNAITFLVFLIFINIIPDNINTFLFKNKYK